MLELGDDGSGWGADVEGIVVLGAVDCCLEQADTSARALRHKARMLAFINHLIVYRPESKRYYAPALQTATRQAGFRLALPVGKLDLRRG